MLRGAAAARASATARRRGPYPAGGHARPAVPLPPPLPSVQRHFYSTRGSSTSQTSGARASLNKSHSDFANWMGGTGAADDGWEPIVDRTKKKGKSKKDLETEEYQRSVRREYLAQQSALGGKHSLHQNVTSHIRYVLLGTFGTFFVLKAWSEGSGLRSGMPVPSVQNIDEEIKFYNAQERERAQQGYAPPHGWKPGQQVEQEGPADLTVAPGCTDPSKMLQQRPALEAYKCRMQEGVVVRKGQGLETKKVGVLTFGSLCAVDQIEGRRAHIVSPTHGWISLTDTAGERLMLRDPSLEGIGYSQEVGKAVLETRKPIPSGSIASELSGSRFQSSNMAATSRLEGKKREKERLHMEADAALSQEDAVQPPSDPPVPAWEDPWKKKLAAEASSPKPPAAAPTQPSSSPPSLASWEEPWRKRLMSEPGEYVAKGSVLVRDGAEMDSKRVCEVPANTALLVLETKRDEKAQRVRARIAHPPGWITMANIRENEELLRPASAHRVLVFENRAEPSLPPPSAPVPLAAQPPPAVPVSGQCPYGPASGCMCDVCRGAAAAAPAALAAAPPSMPPPGQPPAGGGAAMWWDGQHWRAWVPEQEQAVEQVGS